MTRRPLALPATPAPIFEALRAPDRPGTMPLVWWVEPRPWWPQNGRLCPLAGLPNRAGALCADCRLGCRAERGTRRWWPRAVRSLTDVDRLGEKWMDVRQRVGHRAQAELDAYWRWRLARARAAIPSRTLWLEFN